MLSFFFGKCPQMVTKLVLAPMDEKVENAKTTTGIVEKESNG